MTNYLKNKVVLITGSAGSIGSELTRQVLMREPKQLIALDQDETGVFELWRKLKIEPMVANIRDGERMNDIFKQYQPDIVFHAAAYKHVGLMEEFPTEAYKTNVEGTQNLVDAALSCNTQKFVLISTDKAVKPTCVMGKTKKEAEGIVLDAGFIVVRFGNVLGSRGSVIPIWREQIEAGGPLTITHPDMQRYLMSIYQACQLVIKAGEIGSPGEILVFDMGEPVKILGLAKTMILLSGKDIEIEFIGIRPGEKLFEELIGPHEKARKKNGMFVIRKEV